MAASARLILDSASLRESGRGARFDLPRAGGEGKGFAVRYMGVARAYMNRCPHLGVELDWQPGEFFEPSGLYLVCSTHGALFEPSTGLCVAGPCHGARLERLPVEERDGFIHILDDSRAPAPQAGVPDPP
jgi:nitrite reductase/ring-hydroxylating ferredoxin subunit